MFIYSRMATLQIICISFLSLLPIHHCTETIQRQWKQPRNQFWVHIQEEQMGLEDDSGEHYHDMQRCLQSSLHIRRLEEEDEYDTTIMPPAIVDTLTDSKNRTILVEVANAISPLQAQAIKDLAACTQTYFPNTRIENRGFEGTGGGNDVTFINILLQMFLPQVYDNVVRITEMAHKEARWGTQLKLRPPSICGLRTSEYLDYGQFKGLGGHTDAGSIYTTLIALSDSKGYKGGEYYIVPRNEPNDRQYYFKPRQYSAIIFLSETHHGVTDIESGIREMFTNEFWMYDDPPWPASRRPENDDMERFSNRCYEELDVPSDDYYHSRVDMDRLWPSSSRDRSRDNEEEDDDNSMDDLEDGDSGDDAANHEYESEL